MHMNLKPATRENEKNMITRRDYLKYSALAGAASMLPAQLLQAARHEGLITRAIPKTGEALPVVGLGSSATFSSAARGDDVTALREVLSTLFDNGGSVFDTAPGYGASEEVAGGLVQELDATEKVFWATKVNVVPRGSSGPASEQEARQQIERSFDYIGKDPIDLIQVHNLRGVPTQLAILKELKEEGRLRYTGVTYTGAEGYAELARVMTNEPIDFIGIDYAVDNREAADEILPLAAERGIGVLGYVPFGRTRLWSRVRGRELPDWAAEFGAASWAQFFIKFVAAHPAMTAVTPATSKAENMLDNLGAATGELPDKAMQRRMAEFVDALPSA
jgi:aryl-alcohol dehydrogenase-like predicted oxidoreductase